MLSQTVLGFEQYNGHMAGFALYLHPFFKHSKSIQNVSDMRI